MHRREASGPGPLAIELGEQETLLWAAAFRNTRHGLDENSRRDLAAEVRTITWQAPEAGWTLTAVVSQPHDLDYLDRRVAERWIDLLLAPHEQRLAGYMGSTLQAYSTDELVVLGGNILFSDELLARFQAEKGFDPRPLRRPCSWIWGRVPTRCAASTTMYLRRADTCVDPAFSVHRVAPQPALLDPCSAVLPFGAKRPCGLFT